MSTSDKNVANDTFPNVRSDLNAQLAAIASQQSGTADPATMLAYERQARTDLGIIRRRNAANSGWLIDGTLSEDYVIARSSDTILAQAQHACYIAATSTFTQTFTAAATLGDGWWCGYRNDGAGVITLDFNSTEQGDGATTITLNPGDSCIIVCDGAGFKTFGRREIASQADMEAGTSVVAVVTPGRQHFHPSAAKAWARFNGTGTPAITNGYNAAGVTDLGTGLYGLNLTTAFSAATAACPVVSYNLTDGTNFIDMTDADTVDVRTRTEAGGAADASVINVVVFGDQ